MTFTNGYVSGAVCSPSRAGFIKPGTRNATPVISLDWLPTFIDIAGAKAEDDWKLDGMNLLPLFKDPAAILPSRPLFWRTSGSKGPIAVRHGDWKLIMLRGKKSDNPQLYNFKDDISESKELAAEQPEMVKELVAMIEGWETELVEPLW